MSLARKRSWLTIDGDDEDARRRREPSPALSALSESPKKSRTRCELDELGVIGVDEAWRVDVNALMASPRLLPREAAPRHVSQRYTSGESIVVLCVQGNVQTHYELLCSVLPDLYRSSPSLQAFILCHDPSTHTSSSPSRSSLPMIQAVDPPNNHFVRLGLLHPLGGGKFPLDALVVLDPQGRRRLVLPFGWGAGTHTETSAGRGIRDRMTELLKSCVKTLEDERWDGDTVLLSRH